MKKILNYFTGVIITFLFLIFNELDAIPSKYRLGIAAVILIFDAIVVIYELIESMKKNKSAKVLLQENILYDQYIYDFIDFENESSFSRM